MLNKNIAKLDDYFLFVAVITVIFTISLWPNFKIELLLISLSIFIWTWRINLNINTSISSVVQVILIVAELISYNLLHLRSLLLSCVFILNVGRYLAIHLLDDHPIIFLNSLSNCLIFHFHFQVNFFIGVRDNGVFTFWDFYHFFFELNFDFLF